MSNTTAAAVVFLLTTFIVGFLLLPKSPEAEIARYAKRGNPMAELLRALPLIAKERGLTHAVSVVSVGVKRGIISNDDCHTLLHLVGHEAYQLLGEDFDGIFQANQNRLCLGGYLHGVEAQIAQEQFRSKEILWKFCEEVKKRGVGNGPCFHGVGHSSFELSKDVSWSLAQCDALVGGPEPELWNCYRGVFSELGNALLGIDSNTGISTEPLRTSYISVERPFAYCDRISLSYQEACYTQLAKVFIDVTSLSRSIERCLLGTDVDDGRALCVTTVTGVFARTHISASGFIPQLDVLNHLDAATLDAAFSGLSEGHRAIGGGMGEDIKISCNPLTLDLRLRCMNMLVDDDDRVLP